MLGVVILRRPGPEVEMMSFSATQFFASGAATRDEESKPVAEDGPAVLVMDGRKDCCEAPRVGGGCVGLRRHSVLVIRAVHAH